MCLAITRFTGRQHLRLGRPGCHLFCSFDEKRRKVEKRMFIISAVLTRNSGFLPENRPVSKLKKVRKVKKVRRGETSLSDILRNLCIKNCRLVLVLPCFTFQVIDGILRCFPFVKTPRETARTVNVSTSQHLRTVLVTTSTQGRLDLNFPNSLELPGISRNDTFINFPEEQE